MTFMQIALSHWKEPWMGLRSGLDVLKKINISCPCGQSSREKCVFVMVGSIQYTSDK
jgi:hypothetical protein